MTATPKPARARRTPSKASTPAPAPAATFEPLTAERLAAATVVLELKLGTPSFKRPVGTSEVAGTSPEFDVERVHVRKDILDPAVLADLVGLRGRLYRYLRAKSVPCKMLHAGMWLIPLALIEEVSGRIDALLDERAGLVAALADNFEQHKANARTSLGSLFRETDYPTTAELRSAFQSSRRYLTMNVPAALEQVNKELYARELARVEAEVAEASADIRAALRESFAGMIVQLGDKLKAKEDGVKRATLRDAALNPLQEFLATFAARNLTGDRDLAALAEKARLVLRGVDPDTLRDDASARGRVLGAMGEIRSALSALDVVLPVGRKLADDGEV